MCLLGRIGISLHLAVVLGTAESLILLAVYFAAVWQRHGGG